jgi:4-amino-4-deoxy-L-arabinose transferase-like glycosyltransferase
VILAIFLAAFALRCGGLDTQELRGDEAFGYFFSLSALDEIVEHTLALGEPHPVASYWLQHLLLFLAGDSEFALRFTSVWWSVLSVALIHALASQLALPLPAGSVAALLMALSPYAIWHAQDARMYSMSLALTLASTLLAVRWWQAESRGTRLYSALAYLPVTWLALHAHYFALYIVVAQHVAIVGWALAQQRWRKLALWWGLGLLLLLAWLPWLMSAWTILSGYRGNGDSPTLVDAMVRALCAILLGETAPRPWQWAWAILALAIMAMGALVLYRMALRTSRAALWFLAVYWLIPLAATWLSALNRPIFNERYLVAAVPPAYLLMAVAAAAQKADVRTFVAWVGRAAVTIVILIMLLGSIRQSSDPQFSKTRGWRELAATLEQLNSGVDPKRVRIAQNYPDPTLWYYYRGDVAHLVLPPAPNDAARTSEEVVKLAAEGVERLLLVEQPSPTWDADGIARTALSSEYMLAETTNVARWPVSIWLAALVDLDAIGVEYEGGLHLVGAVVIPRIVAPGGLVEIHLRWQGSLGSIGANEAISVQLLNSTGQLTAQSDRPLQMASLTTAQAVSYAILLPKAMAAGDYQVVAVVYDPSVAGAPRRLTLQGADHVKLGSVTVSGEK